MAQTNPAGRLFIPFLDKESQSNVTVAVCDFGHGQLCPLKYTNTLSNTNLFTLEEQKKIREVFVKYNNVTTNIGPPGAVLTALYKTNYTIKAVGRTVEAEDWIAHFQYTNFAGYEEVRFGGGVFARFRDAFNNGYNVSFNRTGDGTLLTFGTIKQNIIDGLFVRFDDNYPQGETWDFRLAHFDGNHLEEYVNYTNNMLIGKYLMWNPINSNLGLEADFKEPYDFKKHRITPSLPVVPPR